MNIRKTRKRVALFFLVVAVFSFIIFAKQTTAAEDIYEVSEALFWVSVISIVTAFIAIPGDLLPNLSSGASDFRQHSVSQTHIEIQADIDRRRLNRNMQDDAIQQQRNYENMQKAMHQDLNRNPKTQSSSPIQCSYCNLPAYEKMGNVYLCGLHLREVMKRS